MMQEHTRTQAVTSLRLNFAASQELECEFLLIEVRARRNALIEFSTFFCHRIIKAPGFCEGCEKVRQRSAQGRSASFVSDHGFSPRRRSVVRAECDNVVRVRCSEVRYGLGFCARLVCQPRSVLPAYCATIGWASAMADLTWFNATRATVVLACNVHKVCQNCWVVL